MIHSLSHALETEEKSSSWDAQRDPAPHALRFNLEAARPRLADLASRLRAGSGAVKAPST